MKQSIKSRAGAAAARIRPEGTPAGVSWKELLRNPRQWPSILQDPQRMTEFSLGLFYFTSFVSVTMTGRSFLSPVFTLFRFVSYGLLGLLAMYSICGWGSIKTMGRRLLQFFKENILFDLAIVISLLSSYYRAAIEPMILLLLMYTARQLGMKKVISIFFWVASFSTLLTFIGALIKLLPNPAYIRDDVKRWALGFIYPLETHSAFYLIGLSGLYLYWRKSRWVPEVVFVGLSALLYLFTKARFSMILTILTSLLFLIGANIPQERMRKWISSRMVQGLLVIFCLAMFIVPGLVAYNFQWGSSFFEMLNTLVNDRLVFGRQAFAFEPVYPFGSTITWIGYGGANGVAGMKALGETYNYVDCSYIKNMFDYGYVYTCLECGFYMWILLHGARQKDWAMVFAAISVMLLGLFEARLLQVAVNPFVLAGGGLLFWHPWIRQPARQVNVSSSAAA